ncbi:hypothetical protein [Actinotalea sp. Marseille-Q4924]|uniref:hypothetical protein n=1 Tax=Actinotalea sp. Marseille-Q4924 TaxID=2866571 RepID=UPI001CE49D52|nr:hypothetical protein [Actinotalea sp. Marseille-Q4924]
MAVLTGVRDRLRSEMGAEPATWAVVERVLEVVQDRLLALGLESPVTSAAAVAEDRPPGDALSEDEAAAFRAELLDALDRRGLPPDTSLADLLDHVRGTARIAALGEITGDLADVTAENERLRASVAGADRVLEALRASPAAERGGVQEEMVRWFTRLLEDATQTAGAALAELRSVERHAALLAAADDVGLDGMAKVEFVARVSATLGAP